MQPAIVASSRTQPAAELRSVASVLTRCARELGIPVLTSVVPLASGTPELIEELADCTALSRTTLDALDDEAIAEQLRSSARKLVALGGVSSEIALLHTALSLRRMVVSNCFALQQLFEDVHQMTTFFTWPVN